MLSFIHEVMPSDHPQSLHSRPMFSVGGCFAPRPTWLPWGAYHVAYSPWAGAGLPEGGPVGLQPWAWAPAGLPVTSELICVTDGLAFFLRQGRRGSRCVGQQTPIPAPKGSTHRGWATACFTDQPSRKGGQSQDK